MENPLLTPRAFAGTASGPSGVYPCGPLGLWMVDLAVARGDEALLPLLSAGERERHSRYRQLDDRRRFLWGRGALRLLLGPALGVAPDAVRFTFNAFGKPLLDPAGRGDAGIHFNLAHSGRLVVLAFHRDGPVGIDVEEVRDDLEWEAIAKRLFGAERAGRWRSGPAAAGRREFFRAWTRQEAALKAVGTGLGDGAPAEARAVVEVSALALPEGYEGAVAVMGQGSHALRSGQVAGAARR